MNAGVAVLDVAPAAAQRPEDERGPSSFGLATGRVDRASGGASRPICAQCAVCRRIRCALTVVMSPRCCSIWSIRVAMISRRWTLRCYAAGWAHSTAKVIGAARWPGGWRRSGRSLPGLLALVCWTTTRGGGWSRRARSEPCPRCCIRNRLPPHWTLRNAAPPRRIRSPCATMP